MVWPTWNLTSTNFPFRQARNQVSVKNLHQSLDLTVSTLPDLFFRGPVCHEDHNVFKGKKERKIRDFLQVKTEILHSNNDRYLISILLCMKHKWQALMAVIVNVYYECSNKCLYAAEKSFRYLFGYYCTLQNHLFHSIFEVKCSMIRFGTLYFFTHFLCMRCAILLSRWM